MKTLPPYHVDYRQSNRVPDAETEPVPYVLTGKAERHLRAVDGILGCDGGDYFVKHHAAGAFVCERCGSGPVPARGAVPRQASPFMRVRSW